MKAIAFTFGIGFGLFIGFGVGHWVGERGYARRAIFDARWATLSDGGAR